MVQKFKKKNWIFLLTEKPHVPQKNPFHILSNSLRGGHIKAKSSCRYWNIIAIEKSLFFAKYTVIIKYTAYVDKRHWYWQSWQVILYIYYCSRLSCCRSVKTSQRQSYTLTACCTPRTGICSIISSTLNKQTKKIKNLPSSVGLWLCAFQHVWFTFAFAMMAVGRVWMAFRPKWHKNGDYTRRD